MSEDGATRLVPSRYNFRMSVVGGELLYNTSSGRLLRFSGPDAATLMGDLCSAVDPEVDWSRVLPASTFSDLVLGGFIVPAELDEVEVIKERFEQARTGTPVSITIATTMDCNLGCYYCFEERSTKRLSRGDIPQLVELTRSRLAASPVKRLHVSWYGGEPLLNPDFLEEASAALQTVAKDLGVEYGASVVSNGTLWPSDVEAFIRRHRVNQVQISLDGFGRNHDKRRRYRKGYAPTPGASSFDLAVALIDRLVGCCHVDVRFNIDRENVGDFVPLLELAKDRGWFDAKYKAVVHPARLARYSDRTNFMRSYEFDVGEFEEVRAMLRSQAGPEVPMMTFESPHRFPVPRSSVCGALAPNSVVIGGDGGLYRCGLQVGETPSAVGRLADEGRPAPASRLPVVGASSPSYPERPFWARFDPTDQPRCSECSFLPVCWGGCPKRHLEQDTHAILEQGEYWRRRLAGLVVEYTGDVLVGDGAYTEADQFRRGVPSTPCPLPDAGVGAEARPRPERVDGHR